MRKTDLEGLFYRELFRGDEVMYRSVSKELELLAGEMLE